MNGTFRYETVMLGQAPIEFVRQQAERLANTYDALRKFENSRQYADLSLDLQSTHQEAVERVRGEYMVLRAFLQAGEGASYILEYPVLTFE